MISEQKKATSFSLQTIPFSSLKLGQLQLISLNVDVFLLFWFLLSSQACLGSSPLQVTIRIDLGECLLI